MKNSFKKLPFFLFLLVITVAFMSSGKTVNAYISKGTGDGSSVANAYELRLSAPYANETENGYANTIYKSTFTKSYATYFKFTSREEGRIKLNRSGYLCKASQATYGVSSYPYTSGRWYNVDANETYIIQYSNDGDTTLYYHKHGYNTSPHDGYNFTVNPSNTNQCGKLGICSCGLTKWTVDPSPHNNSTKTESKDSTCTEEGYTKVYYTCCGHVKSNTTIPKKAHNYSKLVTQDSSQHKLQCQNCTSTMWFNHTYSGNTCTVCNYVKPANQSGTGGSGGSSYSGGGYTYTPSIVPGSLRVTKLDNKKVSITVVLPYDANASEIFFNGKKIKTLYRSGHFNFNKKGAVKGKYKIRSLFTVNGVKKYSGFSGIVKPAKNVRVISGAGSLNPRYVGRYSTCTHRTAKLQFSGNKLKCTAYIYNNRMFKLKRVKIHYYASINGKVYKKTLTKKLSVSAYGKKKITYVVGKGISDVRNGAYSTYIYTDGDWGFGWNQ